MLILAGDHVYKMDYGPFLAAHVEPAGRHDRLLHRGAASKKQPAQLGVMTVDETGRVIAFDEKPRNPNPIPGKPDICLASMGNYVFNTDFLYEQVIKDADTPGTQARFRPQHHPVDHQELPRVCLSVSRPRDGQQAYWRDVGTLDAFWEANMELVSVTPQLNLYDTDWPIIYPPDAVAAGEVRL